MKLQLTIILLLSLSLRLTAQSGAVEGASERARHFAVGGNPILAYDQDLGLKYGLLFNLFEYGKRFPDYRHYLKISASNSTGGTRNLSLQYESTSLMPSHRLLAEFSYINDKTLDFTGFNGPASIYHPEFTSAVHPEFVNRFYYSYQRQLIRGRFNFFKPLGIGNWNLFYGSTINWFTVNEQQPVTQADNDGDDQSLLRFYFDQDLIDRSERTGGNEFLLNAGFTYDTRDRRINTKKGWWFESFIMSPLPVKNAPSYVKHLATLRHYQPFRTIEAVFSWRLSSQQKLAGHVPFYALPFYYGTREVNDGPGGAYTLRGMLRNRVVADGFVLANAEFRKNLAAFSWLSVNWNIDLSLFADAAFITQKYAVDLSGLSTSDRRLHFSDAPGQINATYGGSISLIYNTNNILAVHYGFSPDPQLGAGGLYVVSGFLF